MRKTNQSYQRVEISNKKVSFFNWLVENVTIHDKIVISIIIEN